MKLFNWRPKTITLDDQKSVLIGRLLAIIRNRSFLNFRRGCRVPGNAVQFEPEVLQVVIGHGMNQQFFDNGLEIGQRANRC